ncbi:TrmH family RNA methyltransferase [Candidatus Saccharibacteria bacterium]|nr:TrmH family RNA methyltransferase [Candidatus Saccharibacteria bacterium]
MLDLMKIVVILHNIRSTYNVGAILRSCDGFGVDEVIISGYTPKYNDPTLLPHLREKLNKQIAKVALGAEKSVLQRSVTDVSEFLDALRSDGFTVVGLENNISDNRLVKLCEVPKNGKVALLLGEEVSGIADALYPQIDVFAEIPMRGEKESFNVSVAAGIALYELRR